MALDAGKTYRSGKKFVGLDAGKTYRSGQKVVGPDESIFNGAIAQGCGFGSG